MIDFVIYASEPVDEFHLHNETGLLFVVADDRKMVDSICYMSLLYGHTTDLYICALDQCSFDLWLLYVFHTTLKSIFFQLTVSSLLLMLKIKQLCTGQPTILIHRALKL